VGTERALFMTLIMLTSVLLDRQALTMRNLAIAAALVILIQPEAIMGASFQLSFAAVAALDAVYEARMAAWSRDEPLANSGLKASSTMRLRSPSTGRHRDRSRKTQTNRRAHSCFCQGWCCAYARGPRGG
jgi:hypothetical protein